MATTATTLVVAEEDEEGEEEEEAAADKLFSGLLIYYIDYDFLCLVHFPLEIKMKQARASFAAAARIKINNLMIKEEKKETQEGFSFFLSKLITTTIILFKQTQTETESQQTQV